MMKEEELTIMIRESKELVESAIGDSAPLLMKTLLTAKVFDLKTSGQLNRCGVDQHAMQESAKLPPGLEINEFVKIINPTSHVETVTLFGYYLESTGTSVFGNDELADLYGRCKKKLPANLPDTISKAIQRGYLVEVEAKTGNAPRKVRLTLTGRGFVALKLSAENGAQG